MSQFKNEKKTIVFDLDGTLSDFERIDHEIIEELFLKSKLVKLIDKFAWCINRKDILKNTMPILILRLVFYAIISGHSVKYVLDKYRQEYFFKTCNSLRKIYPELSKLCKKYRVRVVSNNKYSNGIQYKRIKVRYIKSKFKFIKYLKKNKHDIIYIVGNNLCDDIIVAKLLKDNSIYIGRNKLIKFISNKNFDNVSLVLDYLNTL